MALPMIFSKKVFSIFVAIPIRRLTRSMRRRGKRDCEECGPPAAVVDPVAVVGRDLVKRDLARGYISAEVAARDYGLSANEIAAVENAVRKGEAI